ncbi:MAG TPA: hypothetical protein VLG76_01445 [Rhabdochlamydiaceae bacterium]|nr:hypothetical protein [Rhabdochlamydiaceae bacterium]
MNRIIPYHAAKVVGPLFSTFPKAAFCHKADAVSRRQFASQPNVDTKILPLDKSKVTSQSDQNEKMPRLDKFLIGGMLTAASGSAISIAYMAFRAREEDRERTRRWQI